MTAAMERKLDKLPALLQLMARAAIARGNGDAEPNFPDQLITLGQVDIDRRAVARYAQVCGFQHDNRTLPPSYLHTLAFRLQMQLMLDKAFPVAPMGCVHLSNRIVQYRAARLDDTLSMTCRVAGHQLTPRGVEFDFVCEAHSGDELLWQDFSSYLSRRKTGASGGKRERPAPRVYPEQLALHLQRQTARQYARASGDFNPIHLHDLSAKALGFKRMVIHGMWSKAACMAALIGRYPDFGEALSCHVEFKTPVFLPATTLLCFDPGEQKIDFELRDEAGRKPHLIGSLNRL